jgi:hypothetical protein
VSKRSSDERGWIFSDRGIDSFVVLENVAASVIGGQVKGYGAILASLAREVDTHKEKRTRGSYFNDEQHYSKAMHNVLLPLLYSAPYPICDVNQLWVSSHDKCFHSRRISIDHGFMEQGAPIILRIFRNTLIREMKTLD